MNGGLVANTTVTILRGEATDTYLDDTDPPAPLATGVVVSLLDTGGTSTRRSEQRPQTVRRYVMRVPDPTVDLQDDDRVRDETTDLIYVVLQVNRTSSPITGRSLNADLRLVN